MTVLFHRPRESLDQGRSQNQYRLSTWPKAQTPAEEARTVVAVAAEAWRSRWDSRSRRFEGRLAEGILSTSFVVVEAEVVAPDMRSGVLRIQEVLAAARKPGAGIHAAGRTVGKPELAPGSGSAGMLLGVVVAAEIGTGAVAAAVVEACTRMDERHHGVKWADHDGSPSAASSPAGSAAACSSPLDWPAVAAVVGAAECRRGVDTSSAAVGPTGAVAAASRTLVAVVAVVGA